MLPIMETFQSNMVHTLLQVGENATFYCHFVENNACTSGNAFIEDSPQSLHGGMGEL